MARDQTIFSEIYCALAINNSDDLLKIEGIKDKQKDSYKRELEKRIKTKSGILKNKALFESGKAIREEILKNGINSFKINWTAPEQMGGMESVAKDLEISPINWRISIKENANVFINSSPITAFIDLPKGNYGQKVRGYDWFLNTAPEEIQYYYEACGGSDFNHISTIEDYYKKVKGSQRKKFSEHVANLHKINNPKVLQRYQELCNKVSEESARIFNENFLQFEKERKNKNRLTPIFHFFFKINGVSYYLIGSEGGNPLTIHLPSSSEWTKKYEFLSIEALPNCAGQPEVILKFKFKDKIDSKEFEIPLKIEVRWSHGKFCGNPEAKVYKQWSYKELPWVKVIR